MTIPCPSCGGAVRLIAAKDVPQGEDTGPWCRFCCECGADGYICQRDYLRWIETMERRKLIADKR